MNKIIFNEFSNLSLDINIENKYLTEIESIAENIFNNNINDNYINNCYKYFIRYKDYLILLPRNEYLYNEIISLNLLLKSLKLNENIYQYLISFMSSKYRRLHNK